MCGTTNSVTTIFSLSDTNRAARTQSGLVWPIEVLFWINGIGRILTPCRKRKKEEMSIPHRSVGECHRSVRSNLDCSVMVTVIEDERWEQKLKLWGGRC